MKKILIIGASGTGKSTLANQLGQLLQLPVIHLDAYFWNPGWVSTPREQFDQTLEQLLKEPTWIIDGNYMRTLDWRLTYADLVIYLDYPRHLSIFRAVKRRIQFHGKTRPDMAPGCPEKFDWEFFKWLWNFKKDIAPKIETSLISSSTPIIRLKSPSQTHSFLQRISERGFIL